MRAAQARRKGGGGGRRPVGNKADSVGAALEPAHPLAQFEMVDELVIEIAAEIDDVRAAAVGQVDPRPVVADANPRRVAGERVGPGIEAGIGTDLVAVLDHRRRQQPLTMVVEIAAIDHQAAAIEIVADIRGDLAALLGGELRIAQAVARGIIAADHEGRVLSESARRRNRRRAGRRTS